MAGTVYGKFGMHLAQAGVNLLTSPLKAMLVNSTYTLDVSNHEFLFDIGAVEITGTGYTAGGITLANKTLTYDAVLRSTKLDADDAAFGALTATDIAGLIVYVDQGTPQASQLVAHHSMPPQSMSGEPFTYYWHADGVVNFTV